MSDAFRRRLARRFAAIAGRLMVTSTTPGTGASPARLDGETFVGARRKGVALFSPWGVTSIPLPGSEAIYLQVGGAESHLVLIGSTDPRYQEGLAEGEVALWTDEDVRVHLKRGPELVLQCGGDVTVEATAGGTLNLIAAGDVAVDATGNATVDCVDATITATGDVDLTGLAITIDGTTIDLNGILSINGAPYLSHTHVGSPTAALGPVSNTGIVV